MTRSRNINSARAPWTDAQNDMLRQRYPHEQTDRIAIDVNHGLDSTYRQAGRLGLKKTAQYLASPMACRLRRGDDVGSAHRFEPGQTPWNKGGNYVAGGRSAETRFEPGHRPSSWRPIGSIRIADGYQQRKMTDTGYPPRDWVGLHILIWQEQHGAVPAKHCIIFKDGNKMHATIDNLECISRRDLMARNSVHNLPPDLAHVIQLRGALNRQINKRSKP